MSAGFQKGVALSRQGYLQESRNIFVSLLQQNKNSYEVLLNLGAIAFQLNDIQEAISFNNKAIEMDPFGYIAYYNRFLCELSLNQETKAWSDLQKALSCLYLCKAQQLNNSKYYAKALKYCEHNVKAYLARAASYSTSQIKLAQNDYDLAVQYAPNMPECFQKRALFYRNHHKQQEFQCDFQQYLKLKKEKIVPFIFPDMEEIITKDNLLERIKQNIKQFISLLEDRKYPAEKLTQQYNKLPLNSIKSTIQKDVHEDQELLLSDRPIEENIVTSHIQPKQNIEIKNPLIARKSDELQKNFQKNYEEIFQDQDSGAINNEIDRIQRQIQAKGGKISLSQNLEIDLDSSGANNFISLQIQKAIEEIENIKENNPKEAFEVRSYKSLGSSGSFEENILGIQILKEEELQKFKQFQIEIIRMQLFKTEKQEDAKVILSYGGEVWETKEGKFKWSQTFKIPIIKDQYDLKIKIQTKRGFLFKDHTILGEGAINLAEKGATQCVLNQCSKEEKSGILYYKVKLL